MLGRPAGWAHVGKTRPCEHGSEGDARGPSVGGGRGHLGGEEKAVLAAGGRQAGAPCPREHFPAPGDPHLFLGSHQELWFFVASFSGVLPVAPQMSLLPRQCGRAGVGQGQEWDGLARFQFLLLRLLELHPWAIPGLDLPRHGALLPGRSRIASEEARSAQAELGAGLEPQLSLPCPCSCPATSGFLLLQSQRVRREPGLDSRPDSAGRLRACGQRSLGAGLTARPGAGTSCMSPQGPPLPLSGVGEGPFRSYSCSPDIPGVTLGVAGGNGRRWGSRIGVWGQ